MYNNIANEDWSILTNLLPKNWEASATETKSIKRVPKGFNGIQNVLRTILLHVGKGYSLAETSVRIKESNIGTASAVGIMKALRRSEEWLRLLCENMYEDINKNIPSSPGGIKMRLIDGSIVKEPGKTGSQWRVHYSISLPNLNCDHFSLLPVKGKGNGESLKQYPVAKGDCLIADRGYSRAEDIYYVDEHQGYSMIRLNTAALPLYQPDHNDKKFDLLSAVKSLSKPYDSKEFKVCVKIANDKKTFGRICVIKKSDKSIEIAVKKLKRNAKKKQITLKAETIEFAKYVIIFTTLPPELYDTNQVLEWYRVRWQIELVFKRLKSIAGLGHLPKYDDASSRSWLYAKLLIGLLANKLSEFAKTISPWGYCIS